MSGDRLFDGPPAPDAELERLEQLLAPHGLRPPTRRWRSWPVVLAASLLLVAALGLLLLPRLRPTGWEAVALEGAPRLGGSVLAGEVAVRPGQWLETGEGERARLSLGLLGRVDLEPGSRLQVVSSKRGEHRLRLATGELRATTLMPPRWFFVETPAGEAIDLGCAFVLETDPTGRGRLDVTSGYVAFEGSGRESLVPAGGWCAIDPTLGPGTPLRLDASAAFREAVAALDREGISPERLASVLGRAEAPDGLSLWHLLSRTVGPARERVHDRLAELCPPPERVEREAVLQLNEGALARWQWPLRQAWAPSR